MTPESFLPVFPFPSGREGDVREAVVRCVAAESDHPLEAD